MKVIIPILDNESNKDTVASGFHNAEYACIYDCGEKTSEWVSFSDLIKNAGNLTVELKTKGIYTVIAPFIPIMALGLFIDSNFKVYKATGKSVTKNIDMYLDNKLLPYTPQMVAGGLSCSSSCSSCGIDCK